VKLNSSPCVPTVQRSFLFWQHPLGCSTVPSPSATGGSVTVHTVTILRSAPDSIFLGANMSIRRSSPGRCDQLPRRRSMTMKGPGAPGRRARSKARQKTPNPSGDAIQAEGWPATPEGWSPSKARPPSWAPPRPRGRRRWRGGQLNDNVIQASSPCGGSAAGKRGQSQRRSGRGPSGFRAEM